MTSGTIAVVIILICVVGIAAILMSHFRLQRHRADAAAMSSYREFAEEAAAHQKALEQRLQACDARLAEIEKLLRSVD